MIIDPSDSRVVAGPVPYQVLTAVVIPRPIGFISSISRSGMVNLAPFSFFNAVCGTPPMVMFAAMNRNPAKDSLTNVRETGDFVANAVSREIAEKMNLTAGDYPHGVNEFDVAGLTAIPSDLVRAPRLLESPVNMECRVRQIINAGPNSAETYLVLGEVVRFHVRDTVIGPDGVIDPGKLDLVGRLGGTSYVSIKDRFDLIRPVINPAEWQDKIAR